MKDYYLILEVTKSSSKETIDKAYLSLSQKYNPSNKEGTTKIFCENKMQDINEAYEVLSNEFLRAQYNIELEKQEFQQYKNIQKEKEEESKPKLKPKKLFKKADTENGVYEVGSFSALIILVKELFKNKPQSHEKLSKKGIYAVILTIIIIVILGIILWLIPFTNWWIKELIFENPLFSWITNT